MLSIGFAGAGLIAWAHAMGLQAMIQAGIIDAGVTAVYEIDGARSQGFAAFNAATAVASLAELVESCDAIWVCTPTAAHLDAVEEVARRGRALFCEKPLGTNLDQARQIAGITSRAAIPAQVGLVLRHAPVFRALRELVRSGELGDVMSVVLRDDQYFPVQGLYASTWRGDVAVAGGGCLVEHSIHDLDILRHCLGEVVSLSATTSNFAGHPGIEDVAVVTLRFASGASAELVSVWHDVLSRPSTRRLELFGRQGMAWLDDDHLGPLHVQTSDGESPRPCPMPDWVDGLALARDDVGLAVRMYCPEDRAFLDAVAAGAVPEPGFDEALAAHELVDAAYRSAAAGGAAVSPS